MYRFSLSTMYWVDYHFSDLGLVTKDGRIVGDVSGRADIEIRDGYIHDVDIWLTDEVQYANGQFRCDGLRPDDPLYQIVRAEIERLWDAGKIEGPSADELAADEAANDADDDRSDRLAMADWA